MKSSQKCNILKTTSEKGKLRALSSRKFIQETKSHLWVTAGHQNERAEHNEDLFEPCRPNSTEMQGNPGKSCCLNRHTPSLVLDCNCAWNHLLAGGSGYSKGLWAAAEITLHRRQGQSHPLDLPEFAFVSFRLDLHTQSCTELCSGTSSHSPQGGKTELPAKPTPQDCPEAAQMWPGSDHLHCYPRLCFPRIS